MEILEIFLTSETPGILRKIKCKTSLNGYHQIFQYTQGFHREI